MTRTESFQERREQRPRDGEPSTNPPPPTHPISLPWGPWPSPSPLGVVGMQGHLAGLIDEGGSSHWALRLLFAEHTDSSPLTSCRPPRLLNLPTTTTSHLDWRELMPEFLMATEGSGRARPWNASIPSGNQGTLGPGPLRTPYRTPPSLLPFRHLSGAEFSLPFILYPFPYPQPTL